MHARSSCLSIPPGIAYEPLMSTTMTLESSFAGLIIGRGGSNVKSIETGSGAAVRVVDGDTFTTRKVIVTGDDAARKTAVDAIRKMVGEKVLNVVSGPARPPRSRGPRRPNGKRDSSSPLPPSSCEIGPEAWAVIDAENAETERKKLESLPGIVKNVYAEHDRVKAMSADAVAVGLAKNRIAVKYVKGDGSRPIPKPIETFEHAFHQYPQIVKSVEQQRFTRPTPVQCQAWPIIMSGHDLIAVAQTGTGKTLAYVLPALIHLIRQPTPRLERIGPTVVVLGPTRELVQQIEQEIKKYLFDGIGVLCAYGGVPMEPQMTSLLNDKPEILVATPGRLNDLVGVTAAKLDHVSYLVLDEADRMLDMGFRSQIELALRHVRADKQTILTSATWPKSIQDLADYFTADPLHITIGSLDLTTVDSVEQKIVVIKKHEKIRWLEEFLKKSLSKDDKVIIFMGTKADVDRLYKMFQDLRIECRCIHSGKTQIDREATLSEFRNGVVSILIATGLVSRGLDIDNLTLVINYDFPLDIEDYVHRVGRTGRAGKSGSAISLFTYKDKKHASSLIGILENSKQPVPKELLTMIDN